ncbi:MAG: acetate/propionate family kinase [Betaproteobacteria bacterium]
MPPASPVILTLNGGSSSIRFGVYRFGVALERQVHGKLDRIGLPNSSLHVSDADGASHDHDFSSAKDFPSATKALLDWLDAESIFRTLSAVGHRVVHGTRHTEPAIVTADLLDELRSREWSDPDHLPGEIDLMDAVRAHAPALPQVACFDTSFHQGMPRVAMLLAIPRRLEAKGVRRYGFHGLSYAYLIEELAHAAGPSVAHGRVILAHLGNGASVAAVQGGKSIDTSMGFTPASGLPMGTRSGDIDPGLALYLEKTEQMTPGQIDTMLNHESGLLGISETSSDMRDLLAREATDSRAADAVAVFCYQAKKWVGAYAAALGGLDTLVFAGGIGENAPQVRARICEGLGFLGIEIDPSRNAANAGVISTEASQVSVRVIRTDEELMIARAVCQVVGYRAPTGEVLP